MSSPGFGRTEVKIILFCFVGKWKKNDKNITYTPDLKKEVDIDRFVRKERLINTDVTNQLNKHLSRLVKEGWLHEEDNKYGFLPLELLGLSMLLLFVATYDPDALESLLLKTEFKESWNYFKDTLFFDIYPFTQEYDLEGEEKSIITRIVDPPKGSENIEKLLNNTDRRRTILDTINKLEHEKKEFRYFLLANPFENRKVCDALLDLSLKHQSEFVENQKGRPKYSDKRIRSRLSRLGWMVGLSKIGFNLNNDLNLWKTGTYHNDMWNNPTLVALESKFFSSKKFAVYLSTLVVSGSLYRYSHHHNEAKIDLPVSYRAIATEQMLAHPINLIPLLGHYMGDKKPEEMYYIKKLSRKLVKPDPLKNIWQPVYALPYRDHSALPAGHPWSYPLIALAILLHGTLEADETIDSISRLIGEETKILIEKNSFPANDLPLKVLNYYVSLRDFVMNEALPMIELEYKERVTRFRDLDNSIKNALERSNKKEFEDLKKELDSELTSQFIKFHLEGIDSDD